MSPQPTKVRTILSAKSGSRICRAAALSARQNRVLWKQQGMKSIKQSALAHSHVLLPTTTRALIPTPSTEKLHDQIQENQLLQLVYRTEVLSCNVLLGQGEQRNKTQNIKLDKGGREGTKDVSVTNESTYNCVSKARESKMPGSSSVRSLKSISLKATRDEIDQIVSVGSISRPIAHHYQSSDFNSLN